MMGSNRVAHNIVCALLIAMLFGVDAAAESMLTQAGESVVLQLKWKHQFQFAGYYAAKEKGFYKEAGLDVEIREHPGQHSPIRVLLDGEADYAVAGSSVLIHRAKGHPVVALAAIYQQSPYALLVRADSGIRDVSGLAGRRIMLGVEMEGAVLHAMLKRGGLTETDFERLPGSFDARSLLRNETDAFNAYLTDQGYLLGEAGIDYRYIKPRDYGIDFYGDVLVTSEREIAKHPQRVEKFRQATLKGWAYALSHVDELVELILDKYNTQGRSREHLLYEAEVSKALIQPLLVEIGYMNPQRWRHIQSIFIELGLLGPNSQMDGMIYRKDVHVPAFLSWATKHYVGMLFVSLVGLALLLLVVNARMRREVNSRVAELLEMDRHYRTIFNAAPEGMLLVDPTLKALDVNERLLSLLGYEKEELLGKSIFEFVDEENREILSQQTPLIPNTERRSYEISIRRKDGHNLLTRISAVTLRNKEGRAVSSIAFVEDITEHKRLEAELLTGEQNLRRLINAQPACVSTQDAYGHLLSINPMGLEMLQADSFEQISGELFFELIDEPYRQGCKQLNDAVFKGQSGAITFSITGRKGRKAWVETHAVPIMDAQGEVVEHLGLTHDVTDRLKAEMQVFEDREFLQAVIDSISDSVVVIDVNLQIQLMNQSVKSTIESLGVEPTSFKRYLDLPYVTPSIANGDEPISPVRMVLESGQQASAILTRPASVAGADEVRVEVIASPLKYSDGSLRGVIEVARDITEHLELLDEVKQQKDNLQHLAHHDSLTNLPNRALFLIRLKQAISKAKRSGLHMAVLFVDLDRFKEINDSLGHAVGDRVLKEAAKRFQQSVREEDLIARLGGDEFTFIVEALQRPQHAAMLAQQIIETLGQPFDIDNHQFFLTASIGISVYPQDGKSAEMLLRNADAAMYKAKDEGKNTFQFYTEDMTEQAFERIFLEASLRRALDRDQLVVYYQPQVKTSSGQIIGVEALVRWINPDMGLVSPSRFIPLAEDTGLIIPLGEQVMRMACEQMVKWRQQGLSLKHLSINLSGKQISSKGLLQSLHEILSETGCRSEWLEFEVTEGYLIKDPEKSVAILKQLRELGVELAVDDFGTGYSSLAYLKRFPLTRLKIDQSFIRDVPEDAEDIAITRAIIALAHSLNLKVLAEGVENEAQRDFLLNEGCHEAQGFYYGRPVTATEMTLLLEKNLRAEKDMGSGLRKELLPKLSI